MLKSRLVLLSVALLCVFSFSAKETSRIVTNDTVTLNELSVTAIKQDSRLITQPVASTVLTQADLDELNAVSIKGISDAVPNFYIPDYGSRITSSIYVRGIGARMDQPAVGLNVDNVPFLNKDTYDFDIPDIVSVEMLRGPQSTLYGRNTMAGLINISTLSPFRYHGWRISAEGATNADFRGSVGWYHRFSEKAALSATVSGGWSRGNFINDYNGKYADKEGIGNARFKLELRPFSDLKIMNVLSLGYLSQGGYPYESVASGKIEYNDTCFYHRFVITDGLTLGLTRDEFVMNSITSIQYLNDNMTLDQDFLPKDYFTLTQKKQEFSITEDLVFKNRESGGVYSWLAGAFIFYKHLNMHAPVTFYDYGIANLIEYHRNNINPDYPIRWNNREFTLNSDFSISTWGVALYHESKVQLGAWKLSAGIRFDFERVSMGYHSFCNTGYSIYNKNNEIFRNVNINIDERGNLSRNFFNVMPNIKALYSLNELGSSNIYASVAKGYKAGGFNIQMFSDILQQRLMLEMGLAQKYDVDEVVGYDPESSWNFELGTHLTFLNGNLTLEAAAFYIDCRNQQLTMFPEGSTTGRIMTNAGKTRSFGVELSMNYSPITNLNINVSYGYTNAKFREFYNGKVDLSGKYLPYVPMNTIFGQAIYNFEINKGRLKNIRTDINVRGNGQMYWNEENTLRQSLLPLLGASLTFVMDKLEVQLWGQNLTNSKYYTFYFQSIGNEFLQRGKLIRGGLTVRINF